MTNEEKLHKRNATLGIIAGILIIILTVYPLIAQSGAEFGGADDQGADLTAEIDPTYEPWFEPILEPTSGEVESLLFCIQAGLGAGIAGYALAYYRYADPNSKRKSND